MDIEKLQTICTCFIAGGMAVPAFDVIVGSISSALGMGADVDADLDVDADVDLDVDTDVSAGLPVGAGRGRVPVNLMTLAFTAVVFGAVGKFLLRRMPPVPALAVSVLAGLAGGWAIGKFIILPLKRSRPRALGIRDIKGQEGIVKLELRGDFIGKIAVTSAIGSVVTYSARPMDGIDRITKGTNVRVVDVDVKNQICVVLPLE